MGNRFQGGIRPGAMPWKNRYIGNPVLSGIGKLFFRCPVGDFHCGLRGFSREAFQRMHLQTTGMEFASEMVIKATLLRCASPRCRPRWTRTAAAARPTCAPGATAGATCASCCCTARAGCSCTRASSLTLLGLTLGIALLRGPLTITRHVALDVNSLLVAFAAVVLGFQAVAFSICARSYAYHEGLLPPNPKLDRAFQRFKLETGLIVGALVFLAGLAGILYTVWIWYRHGFGALDAQDTLRLAIPGVTAMCVGGQIVLVSFLLSFMELRRRRHGSSAPP